MYVESFICTDLIACVYPKSVSFNVTGFKEGPSDTVKVKWETYDMPDGE